MAANQLVHLEHVDRVLLKHLAHPVVTDNLALVAGILQVVRLDVLPELLDNLGSGQLGARKISTCHGGAGCGQNVPAQRPRGQPGNSSG